MEVIDMSLQVSYLSEALKNECRVCRTQSTTQTMACQPRLAGSGGSTVTAWVPLSSERSRNQEKGTWDVDCSLRLRAVKEYFCPVAVCNEQKGWKKERMFQSRQIKTKLLMKETQQNQNRGDSISEETRKLVLQGENTVIQWQHGIYSYWHHQFLRWFLTNIMFMSFNCGRVDLKNHSRTWPGHI